MTARVTAPFVGLRPFEEEDSHLFYGRGDQLEELLDRLRSHRLVAVVGSSGCGKSSLVRAGLVPALKAGFLVRSRADWEVMVIKPGKAPVRHLAASVLGEDAGSDPSAEEAAALEQEIRFGGAEPILERLAGRPGAGERNVLLVVDQFEELFRFGLHERNQELRDEAADFVSVLLALAEESTLPVYVVLTMRADFIRDCDDVPELPDALNRSLFLVPRLTREQFREAIEGPVRWADAEITSRLLDRLLNDSSREHDELPVVQHALLQTWREWAKGGEGPLDSVHYERAGTAERALDLDAEAALEGLDEDGIDRVRRIFQALTAMDESNRKIRRPARLTELEGVTGLPGSEIRPLLERFRSERRSLLVWSDDDPDPLVDISHESLIRNWQRLSAWADEEAESVALYRRLARAASDYPDRGGLWRDPKLQIGLDWRERAAPTRTWAERVAPEADFDRAMRFLDDSLRAREEERARREREREAAHERERREARQRLRRTRRLLAAAAGFLVMMTVLAVYAFDQKSEAQKEQRRAKNLERYYSLVFGARDDLYTYPARSLLLASGALGLPPEDVPDLASDDGQDAGRGELSRARRTFLQALARSGGRVVASGSGSLETLTVMRDRRHVVTTDGEDQLVCWPLRSTDDDGWGEVLRRPLQGVTALTRVGERLAVSTDPPGERQAAIHVFESGPDGCPAELASSTLTLGSPLDSLSADSRGRWLVAVARNDELKLWKLDAAGEARELGSSDALPTGSKVTMAAVGGERSNPWVAVGLSKDGYEWVQVWSLGEDGLEGSGVELARKKTPLETLAASPGTERLVVAQANAETTLFDLSKDSPSPENQLEVAERIVAAEMAPDGQTLVTWNRDGGIDLWDLTAARPRKMSDLPPSGSSTLQAGTFHAESDSLFTGHFLPTTEGTSWEVRRWKLQAFDPAKRLLVHQLPPTYRERGIHRMAFSPDRTQALVLDKSNGLSLWSLNRAGARKPEEPLGKARAGAFIGNGRLLVARGARDLEVLQVSDGEASGAHQVECWTADGGGAGVAELAVGPDGRQVMAAEASGRIRVCDPEKGDRGEEIFAPEQALEPPIVAAAFTPDARRLITAGPREPLRIHDLSSGRVGARVNGSRKHTILALDVSPDGRWLVTGGGEGVIRLWDLLAGDGGDDLPEESFSLELRREPVVAVAFSPDGKDVLVGTQSGVTWRWPVLREDRYRLARNLVGHGAVPEELRGSLKAHTHREVFAALLEPEERLEEAPSDPVALAEKDRDPLNRQEPQ